MLPNDLGPDGANRPSDQGDRAGPDPAPVVPDSQTIPTPEPGAPAESSPTALASPVGRATPGAAIPTGPGAPTPPAEARGWATPGGWNPPSGNTGGNGPMIAIAAVALAVVAALAGAGLFLSGYSLGRLDATTPGTPVDEAELFQPFWDAYHDVTERYAGGEVDRKALVEGAIKGMIEALGDPYSSYLTSDEYKESLEGINGQFEGIGAEIATQGPDGQPGDCSTLGPDCRLVIIAPIAGSPAEAAGLLAGDVVLAVDGTSLDGDSIDDARDRIRGPKGTEVVLTIERDGREPFGLPITRDVIQQQEVETQDLAAGSVGYIRITGFSSDASADVRDAIEEDLDAGRRSFILDVRGNPGGFVDAARDITSQFISDGVLFWQEDSEGSQVATEAKDDGLATDESVEVVVLVDHGSASASEILAGAFQDRDRGLLVGQQTFGKGTVQQWTTLEGDSGAFRLTIAKWLTPDKRWIHQVGLTPDVVVEETPDPATGSDPVLERALEVLDEGDTALAEAA